jgi:ABC-type branched-subunit amino acid transport system permease subunit
MALMIAGGIAGLIGFAGASSTGTVNADGTTGSSSTHDTGLAVLAVGGTAAIVGIVLFTTGRTLVTSSTGATFTERRQPRPRSTSLVALGALRALTPQGLSF